MRGSEASFSFLGAVVICCSGDTEEVMREGLVEAREEVGLVG